MKKPKPTVSPAPDAATIAAVMGAIGRCRSAAKSEAARRNGHQHKPHDLRPIDSVPCTCQAEPGTPALRHHWSCQRRIVQTGRDRRAAKRAQQESF